MQLLKRIRPSIYRIRSYNENNIYSHWHRKSWYIKGKKIQNVETTLYTWDIIHIFLKGMRVDILQKSWRVQMKYTMKWLTIVWWAKGILPFLLYTFQIIWLFLQLSCIVFVTNMHLFLILKMWKYNFIDEKIQKLLKCLWF